ncbi:acyltransferase family protein [Gorillibacterium sp. sgz5001074]|uniref:acyltransferase family protein n=1 Tax=Gorillibacterium sp. sgz5001074 TaxID=3446695 RepID=UPI003F6819A7
MHRRYAYLDKLKVVMTALVVLHHISITYGGSGSWYYKEPVNSPLAEGLLTMFTAVNQSFFMGLFFFISGWATPSSFDRKGAGRFLKDRLLRFGFPLAAYLLLLSPLLRFVASGYEGSLGGFLKERLLPEPWILVTDPDLGPLWFLFALLLFNTGYALYRRVIRREPEPARPLTASLILVYLLLTGAANFLIRLAIPVGETVLSLQLAYFPAYIALYAAGITAFRSGWLERLNASAARRWLGTAAVLLVLMPVILVLGGAAGEGIARFEGGFTWQSLFYSFVDPLLGLSISYVLLVRFRDRHGEETPGFRWLSDRAFTVYVIHPPVAVYTAYALRGWEAHPLVKFAAAGSAALLLCWMLAAFMRILLQLRRISHSKPSRVG